MCRRQPGRRCHRHCVEKLTAAQKVLMDLQAGESEDRAAVSAAADRVAAVATELDATGRGRQELRSSIAQLEGHAGVDVDLHRQELAARLVAAEALVDERRRQQRHMPVSASCGDAEQDRLRRAIGKARGDLARTQVQMMLSRDDPAALQRWAGRHREAALAALDLHSQLRMAQAGGSPAEGFLSQSEQRVWRRGSADQAAMVALSHRRAVMHDLPDAFDTVVPMGTREARATGEVYRGAEPEPVEELYADATTAAAASARDHVDSPSRGDDDGGPADGDLADDDIADDDIADDAEPTDREAGGVDRTSQSGQNPSDRATVDRRGRRKTERRQQKRAQQRAGQRRKRELREVRMIVQRVKRLSSKADQGQGTGMECGGVLMLDYFQTNLG